MIATAARGLRRLAGVGYAFLRRKAVEAPRTSKSCGRVFSADLEELERAARRWRHRAEDLRARPTRADRRDCPFARAPARSDCQSADKTYGSPCGVRVPNHGAATPSAGQPLRETGGRVFSPVHPSSSSGSFTRGWTWPPEIREASVPSPQFPQGLSTPLEISLTRSDQEERAPSRSRTLSRESERTDGNHRSEERPPQARHPDAGRGGAKEHHAGPFERAAWPWTVRTL